MDCNFQKLKKKTLVTFQVAFPIFDSFDLPAVTVVT
jgi:hypothetical protein